MADESVAVISAHEPHRFVALDGLRGVAALFIVGFHLAPDAFPHGYLAVDFFFLLSGFVVTYAYQARLEGGQVSAFARARLSRLYPLYLLGLLLGLFLATAKHVLHFQHFSLKNIGLSALLGLFLVPMPLFSGGLMQMFPLNTPAWSLFDEVVANIYHALFFRRRRAKTLIAVIGSAVAALLYAALTNEDLGLGYDQATALWGLVRCLFSYSMGMLLCRLWREGHNRWAMPFPLTVLLLTASLLLPRWIHRNSLDDLALIIAFYPCLLWFNIRTAIPQPLQGLFRLLAESSYAMYIIHMPLLGLLAMLWNRLRHHQPLAVWVQIVFVVSVVFVAAAADHFYDRPARGALSLHSRNAPSLTRRDDLDPKSLDANLNLR